ncbi:MAG TPA: permease [Candidatus Dormibacteraeota bacterium]|nr:permease [Candidatus Dormibacteraeota bacterium]
MFVLEGVARSLQEAFFMFWATLWALVLGFGLSGAVQAFISREQMQGMLGDHRPRTVAKASFFGVISSSCSYAASALAKSLFSKGADFTSAMIFMIASTNLVVELGIVMWLLIGWQFAVAEFVGGAIMIVLLALVLPRVVPAGWLAPARDRLNAGEAQYGEHRVPANPGEAPLSAPRRSRFLTRAGWSDAAGYTISDLTMLRREMAAGYIIAGFLAILVPEAVWRALFITGHGFGSSVENVVLGPLVAVISFVCSVGNVPLAAALWKGGISFGGVISFVFADLITLPLLLIYRRYYGIKITLRLLAAFWAVMSISGLITEYLFKAVGLVPTGHPTNIVPLGFHLDYTSVLNVVALLVFGYLYWLYHNRDRLGGGAGYAKDVVCGMQVQKSMAPATAVHAGTAFYFCSDGCHDRFVANPTRFAAGDGSEPMTTSEGGETEVGGNETTRDPVCGMTVDSAAAAGHAGYAGREYHFCSTGCRDRFTDSPEDFLDQGSAPPGGHQRGQASRHSP